MTCIEHSHGYTFGRVGKCRVAEAGFRAAPNFDVNHAPATRKAR